MDSGGALKWFVGRGSNEGSASWLKPLLCPLMMAAWFSNPFWLEWVWPLCKSGVLHGSSSGSTMVDRLRMLEGGGGRSGSGCGSA